jgi:hypothetical protein
MFIHIYWENRLGGVIVNVLASSVVNGGFEFRSGKTKDYKIGMCCFSANHAALWDDDEVRFVLDQHA